MISRGGEWDIAILRLPLWLDDFLATPELVLTAVEPSSFRP